MIDLKDEQDRITLGKHLEGIDEEKQPLAGSLFTMIAPRVDNMNTALEALDDALDKAEQIQTGQVKESQLREAVRLPKLQMGEIESLLVFYNLVNRE